jgi:hypothetical protein
LLTISVKSKLFNESQRETAKKLLDSLEGDRRRKCRTSNIGAEENADDLLFAPSIRKELLIVSSKKKKKGRIKKQSKPLIEEDDDSGTDDDIQRKKAKTNRDSELDDDGFLKHSDDEDDWSDVDDGSFVIRHLFSPFCLDISPLNLVCYALSRHIQKRKEIDKHEGGEEEARVGSRKRSSATCGHALARVS